MLMLKDVFRQLAFLDVHWIRMMRTLGVARTPGTATIEVILDRFIGSEAVCRPSAPACSFPWQWHGKVGLR